MNLYGGIEAGGTKFDCLVAYGPKEIKGEQRFPTTTPEETLRRAVDFFREQSKDTPLSALGVATFGPVDLNPLSTSYGSITTTPKPGWAHTNILDYFQSALQVPVEIDTDVNGAALGEHRWGAGQNKASFLYLTIGTGIGGGGIINGTPMHGLVHPEMGHILIPHDLSIDPFPGVCPYHGDCFEGLASGTALKERWGQPAETLPPDHPAWDMEANYIALALANFICILSPQRIVLGGGVMQNLDLFPRVRSKVKSYLNGYVDALELSEDIDAYILPPALGKRSGVLGAIALAQQALRREIGSA
jgi:fructokinase